MSETSNAGFDGVFVMDEVSPLASQLVREHLLNSGWLDKTMTPVDTRFWFPSNAELNLLIRHLNRATRRIEKQK